MRNLLINLLNLIGLKVVCAHKHKSQQEQHRMTLSTHQSRLNTKLAMRDAEVDVIKNKVKAVYDSLDNLVKAVEIMKHRYTLPIELERAKQVLEVKI